MDYEKVIHAVIPDDDSDTKIDTGAATEEVEMEDAAPDPKLAEEGIEVEEEGEKPAETPKPEGDASTKKPEKKPERIQWTAEQKREIERMMQARLRDTAKLKELAETLQQYGYGAPEEVVSRIRAEKAKQEAEKLGIADPDALAKYIESRVSEHPEVRKAQKLAQEVELQNEIADLIKRYPDASQDEIEEAYHHKQTEGFKTLRAAYLDRFAETIEEKAARRALDAHKRQAKRGVEASNEPAAKAGEKLKATPKEIADATEAVKRGVYSSVREAIEYRRGAREVKFDF